MHYFGLHHDGKGSWEFLNLTENNPNASICYFFIKDVPDDNGKYVIVFIRYLIICTYVFPFFLPNMK